MPDRRPNEAPERVTAEADRDENEEELSEGLMRDGMESALLVCDLPALSERESKREKADNPVDDTARDEPGAGECLEDR